MHILCLVYTVQPLDNNFITCVNIHNYEHFGRKDFDIGNCLCNANTPYNLLTLAPQCTTFVWYQYIAIEQTSVGLSHAHPSYSDCMMSFPALLV